MQPSLAETRSITIITSERVFARLVDKARAAGMTPSLYAKCLFEAAWAARCGKAADDPVLTDCVDRSLGRRPPAVVPASTVVRMSTVATSAPKAIAVPVPVLIPVPIAVPSAMPISQPRAASKPAGRGRTVLGLAWQTETVVDLIARDEGASRVEINRALWGRGEAPTKGLDVVLSRARSRLATRGIEIESVKGWGWRMSPASRAAWAAVKGAP